MLHLRAKRNFPFPGHIICLCIHISTYPWVIHISIYLCLKYPHPPHPNGPTPQPLGWVGWGYLRQRYMDIWITHGYVDIWIHRHIPRRPPGRLIGGVSAPPAKREVPFCTSVYFSGISRMIGPWTRILY